MKYLVLWSLLVATNVYATHLTPCASEPDGRCLRSCCTDDVNDIYGNEAIAWDQNIGWDSRNCPIATQDCTPEGLERCYVVGFSDDLINYEEVYETCEKSSLHWDEDNQWFFWVYTPPKTIFYPYRLDPPYFPIEGGFYYYKVKACLGKGDNPDRLCSAWTTDTAEIIGGWYTCFDTPPGCESHCWPGAPYRMPHRDGCP